MEPRVYVSENPALRLVLQKLRDRRTGRPEFRRLLRLAGLLLAYEAAPLLPRVEEFTVETPLGVEASDRVVDESKILVVAVLRASVPMALGVLDLYPNAELGFVAATRLEETARMVGERMVFDVDMPYWKTPKPRGKHVLLVDPMLATGSTLSRIVTRLEGMEPTGITVLSLIATRQGIEAVASAAKRVETSIVVAAVDPKLNDKGFIVPGLGDAGDRCFGEA